MVGCAAEQAPFCEVILDEQSGPRNHEQLAELFDLARAEIYPEFAPADVDLQGITIDGGFFQANFDISTTESPPLQRAYRVQYEQTFLDDPPSRAATIAVLMHELKHVKDYVDKDSTELAEFIAWYITTDDVSEYERATDLYVLEQGCGSALIEFRYWVYTHVGEEHMERYLRNYWTPEQIEAWMEEHS